MTRLLQIGVGGRAYGGFAARAPRPPALVARFPRMDLERESRVVSDVADLLHEVPPSLETERKIKRWIQLVLMDVAERRRWWFLEAVTARVLNVADDVVDLLGHIEAIAAVWAPVRLSPMPLGELLDLRQRAVAEGRPNAGVPVNYALEAGRRVHLWPAPAARTAFVVYYTRPIHVSLLPVNWDGILLDGILGKFGRHFDRDALTQAPEEFEMRYERRLMRSAVATGHFDLERISRWVEEQATQHLAAQSAQDGSTELLVPASLLGIGYQSLDDGYYPLEVA